MPTRFLLIRHASVDNGNPPRLCGTYDAPLSSHGRAQLDRLSPGDLLPQRPAALYTSPLTRARETAAAWSRVWGVAPTCETALQEIHCGDFEGLRIKDIQQTHPTIWARNAAQDDVAFRWPGGESCAQFRGRVLGVFSRLALLHPDQTVAVVTHSGVIAQVIGTLRGRASSVWELDRPDPLSITEVLWDGTEPRELITFNRSEWQPVPSLHLG